MSAESGNMDATARIRIGQTAELWMIPKRGDSTPHVVSIHCPTCHDPDNSRLLHVVLRTEADGSGYGPAVTRRTPKVRILLHVTRPQVEEILASFGRHDNGDTLMDILVDKGDQDENRDQKTVH